MKKMEICWLSLRGVVLNNWKWKKWKNAEARCRISSDAARHQVFAFFLYFLSNTILTQASFVYDPVSYWSWLLYSLFGQIIFEISENKDTITPSIRILDTFLWRSLSLNFWCWFPVENNFPATLFFWEVLWLIDQIRQARAGEGAKVCKQPPTFTNTTFYISYFQIFILLCKTIF